MITYELILIIGSSFLFGVTVGKFLGEKNAEEVFEPLVDEYRRQIRDMWKWIKERI